MPMVLTLPSDILRTIMIFVAMSSDGAANLARAISVCKTFMNLAEDLDVLKVVNFDNVKLDDRYELFQQIRGLLNICAQAGHEPAKYMLAKTILVSSSQLRSAIFEYDRPQVFHSIVDELSSFISVSENHTLAVSFMTHFVVDQASTSIVSRGSLRHSELVRSFLCHCSHQDLFEMQPHLDNYVKYIVQSGEVPYSKFIATISRMCIYHDIIHCFLEREDRAQFENASDASVVVSAQPVVVEVADVEELFGFGWEELMKICREFSLRIEFLRVRAISKFDRLFSPKVPIVN